MQKGFRAMPGLGAQPQKISELANGGAEPPPHIRRQSRARLLVNLRPQADPVGLDF
jgi:hypothetical protein